MDICSVVAHASDENQADHPSFRFDFRWCESRRSFSPLPPTHPLLTHAFFSLQIGSYLSVHEGTSLLLSTLPSLTVLLLNIQLRCFAFIRSSSNFRHKHLPSSPRPRD